MTTLIIPHGAELPPIILQARSPVVAFAGPRNGFVPDRTATQIVENFVRHGFGFLIGCAPGIDAFCRSA